MGKFKDWWFSHRVEYEKLCEESGALKVDMTQVEGSKEWAEAKVEKLNAEEQVKFEERAAAWRRFDVANYNPIVTVQHYASGKFLCFDDVSAPIQHIVSIEVADMGSPPTKVIYYAKKDYYGYDYKGPDKYSLDTVCYNKESKARIVINMASGVKYNLYCHTNALDILLDRLKQAWKHGA